MSQPIQFTYLPPGRLGVYLPLEDLMEDFTENLPVGELVREAVAKIPISKLVEEGCEDLPVEDLVKKATDSAISYLFKHKIMTVVGAAVLVLALGGRVYVFCTRCERMRRFEEMTNLLRACMYKSHGGQDRDDQD